MIVRLGGLQRRVAAYECAYYIHTMASDNGDFDTDLAEAPAKRMRYSFADEIAQSSHFEAFGQRFTGFPSGDCYGKYSKKNSDSGLSPVIPQTWRIFSRLRTDILPVMTGRALRQLIILQL